MCLAAVHNGADSIYLGVPGFNARGRAKTFSHEELKQIIDFCHLYGVKVLLAFNVLIFERELEQALSLLEELLRLGPDGFIVQDIGLVRLIRFMAPMQPIHASTQMTVTSHEAVTLVHDLGMKRFVLGREVSIPEIKRIRENTSAELEVFVHGALCVAYSGQCLTSESLGGRSANRGQCAQVCRLAYDLIVDGEAREMGEKRHLVSPKDLCGLSEVDELRRIGVTSFKIEGRLKSAEYVAATVRSYRERIDTPGLSRERESEVVDEMKLTYARDFFSGWLHGVNHQGLVDGRFSQHHGVEAGEVLELRGTSMLVRSKREIRAGDGVIFADFERAREVGTKVYDVKNAGPERYQLCFANEFNLSSVAAGMVLFINSSDALVGELRKTFTARESLRRVPVDAELCGSIGTALILKLSDDAGNTVCVESTAMLASAERAPLTQETLRDEIGALGGSCFALRKLSVAISEPLFIHRRELKELRRSAVSALEQARVKVRALDRRDVPTVLSWIEGVRAAPPQTQIPLRPTLHVLLRDAGQIEALADLELGVVYLDFEFGKEYGPAIKELRSKGFRVGIGTTRILKPGETGHLKLIERLIPDVILVRNLGALHFFQGKDLTLVGDFSLNISNSLSADWFLNKGLCRLTPSYDLNREQLFDLVQAAPGTPFEITVHQYMPAFHMEHCVFAAFLSKGTSWRDCGRPCERHRVELRDGKGVLHPLKADAECRNTMFNGKPQSAARLLPELLAAGVRNFRVEALFESPSELREKLIGYLDLLQGRSQPFETFGRLGVLERYGVTEGQLYNINTWRDRKKEL